MQTLSATHPDGTPESASSSTTLGDQSTATGTVDDFAAGQTPSRTVAGDVPQAGARGAANVGFSVTPTTRDAHDTEGTATGSISLLPPARLQPDVEPRDYPDGDPAKAQVLAAPMQVTTEAAAATASVTSMAASPGAAAQMARILGALGIARLCAIDRIPDRREAALRGEMAFPRSFAPGLSIGPARGGYLRGAIVANTGGVLLIGVVAIALATVAVALGAKPDSASKEDETSPLPPIVKAARLVKMPGALIVIAGAGLSGNFTSAILLFTLSDYSEALALDMTLASVSLLWHVGVLCLIAHAVHRFTTGGKLSEKMLAGGDKLTANALRDQLAYMPTRLLRKADRSPVKIAPGLETFLRRAFLGTHSWLPPAEGLDGESHRDHIAAGRGLLEHFGTTVNRYRGLPPEHCVAADARPTGYRKVTARVTPWFLFIEFLLAMIVSVAEGVTVIDCTAAVTLAIGSNVFAALASLFLLPYTVLGKNVCLVVLNTLAAVSTVVAAAGLKLERGDGREGTMNVASVLAFAAMVAAVVSLALSAAKLATTAILRARLEVDSSLMKGAEGVAFDPLLSADELEALAAGEAAAASRPSRREADDSDEDEDQLDVEPRSHLPLLAPRSSKQASALEPLFSTLSASTNGDEDCHRKLVLACQPASQCQQPSPAVSVKKPFTDSAFATHHVLRESRAPRQPDPVDSDSLSGTSNPTVAPAQMRQPRFSSIGACTASNVATPRAATCTNSWSLGGGGNGVVSQPPVVPRAAFDFDLDDDDDL